VDEFRLLGGRIRELRKKQHLTQEELARGSGVYFKFVGGIERGTVNPTLRVLKKIATALNVSLADLFQYDLDGRNPKKVRRQLADEIRRCSDSDVLSLRRVYDFWSALNRDPNSKD
jgi:transcriptional regulator with XRE-family HTH domain